MKNRINEFIKKMNEVLKWGQTLCFITRGIELQEDACKQLEDLAKETAIFKADVVSQGDEDTANTLLSFECGIAAVLAELRMWIDLKQEKPSEAWDHLISAQNAASAAMRAHDLGLNMSGYISRLEAVEKVVFPPQMFSSIGFHIREATCSLCDDAYAECNHVKGRPYMGEFCTMIIKQCNFQEVSIVEHPRDKRCRVTSFSENGSKRDKMTWRVADDESEASANSPNKKESQRFEMIAAKGV